MYGGDYNPDQWPEETWSDDLDKMDELAVNTVTLPVFSWSNLQIDDDTFNFQWLDRIMDQLEDRGIDVIMATPTAAQPAWMSKKYTDMLPVDAWGRKRKHGGRNNFCPNSPSYREMSGIMAGKMAERYGKYSNVKIWHINNEYGSRCYCENCRQAFISWLKGKYGTLEKLNRCWYTSFWSHNIYDWDEVEVPSNLSEILPGRLAGRDGTNFQIIAVDYSRFMTDSILDCLSNEQAEIKKHIPDAVVTTNIWGIATPLNLFEVGKRVDIASWDNYPSAEAAPWESAFNHDVVRGIKGGDPFLLMEQTPNQQNWMDVNTLKRPGIMRLWSYQAIAHGSDSVLFFQLKQGKSGCEKYHAAMIPHAGRLDTRIGRELIQLGKELKGMEEINGSRLSSSIGLIMDWDSWWALEYSSGPSVRLKYLDILKKYYGVLFEMGYQVDILSPESDFENYSIILAPLFYMVDEEVSERISSYVERGGTFVTSFMSGMVDKNDQVYPGGYPGAFRKLLGMWVEEVDALTEASSNNLVPEEKGTGAVDQYSCGLICDVIRNENAGVYARYGQDFYKGVPAVTVNRYGKGEAWYVGTDPNRIFLKELMGKVVDKCRIEPLMSVPSGVEVTKREKEGVSYYFLLNHNKSTIEVGLSEGSWLDMISGRVYESVINLAAYDVTVLKK